MDKVPKYKPSLQNLQELEDRQPSTEVPSMSLKGVFQSAEDDNYTGSFDDNFIVNKRLSGSNSNEIDQDTINQAIQRSMSIIRESQEQISEIIERSKIFNKSMQDNNAKIVVSENRRGSMDAFFSTTADDDNDDIDDPEVTEGLNNVNKMIEYDLKNLLEQSVDQLSSIISMKGLLNQANPIPQTMLKVIKLIVSSRSNWLQENWQQINKIFSDIRKMLDSVKPMHDQLPEDDFYYYNYNEMVGCVAVEINYNLSNLKTYVILPGLSEELHRGCVEMTNGIINIDKLAFHSLSALLDKLQYETKGYSNDLDMLYKRVSVLIRARRAMVSKRWDDVLLCTEKSIETKARRLRRAKFIDLVMKHGGTVFTQKALMSVSDPSIDMATEEYDFPKGMKDNIKNTYLDSEIRVVAEVVENELELCRLESFNRYAQFLLAQSIKVGPITGTHGDINCEHSFVDPIEVALAETCLLFLSDGQDLMSTLTEFLRNSVELLAIYRGHAIKSEWAEIISIVDKIDQSKVNGNEIIAAAMVLVTDEIGWIICAARNKLAYNKLLNCLSYGTSMSSTTSTKTSNDSDIEAAVNEAMQCNSGDYAGMSDTLKKLIAFARALLDSRVALHSTDVQLRQQASIKLNSAAANLAMPEATLAEVSRLNFKLKYEESKNVLQELLDKAALYVPVVRVNEADKSNDIPHRGDFLYAEGLKLNSNLNIVQLKNAVAEGKAFLESLEKIKDQADSLHAFEQLSKLVRACELTVNLRDKMTLLEWKDSYDILTLMVAENLVEIPTISLQHELYFDRINVYKALELCLDFFDMSSIVGDIGVFEVSSESITKHSVIKEVINSTKLESQLVTDYLDVASVLLSTRKALQARDFRSLEVILSSNSHVINSGIGAISRNEFNRAKVELDNYNLVEQVCESLQEEIVTLKNGILEAKIDKLSCLIKGFAVISDDCKGVVMSVIIAVADVILKLRRAVLQKEWFMTKSILPIVREELANFKFIIDFKHSNNKVTSNIEKQQRKSVGSSFMPSHSVNRRKSAQSSSVLSNGVNVESVMHRIDPRVLAQFQSVHTCLLQEICSIDNYFIFQKLEKDLSDNLGIGAISVEMIGNFSSSINLINTVEIENLCNKATTIETNVSSFSTPLQQLLLVAELIIQLRKSVINNEWDILSSMVEETMSKTKGYLPEVSRQELQIVRHELESRWIVSNLTEALQQETVLGDIDQINLSGVGYLSLLHTLNACKALFPRTSEAIILVNTAEMLIPIRQILCDQVDWRKVNNLASSILEKPEYISPIVLPEVNLLFNYSELVISCDEMVSSLKNSRITGEPGSLNFSNTSIEELDTVIDSADSWTFITPKMSALLSACKYIRNLRNILIEYSKNYAGKNLHDTNETCKYPVWTKCKAIITQLHIEKKSSEFSKYGWLYCKDEITLVLNHLHLVKIHRDIIDSISSNSDALQSRKHTHNSSATSVKASMWKLNMEVARSCKDLDVLLDYTKAVEFDCKALKAYIECIEAIKSMRTALIKDHWDVLDAIVLDPTFKSKLEIVPAAINEYMEIRSNTMNREVIDMITHAMKLSQTIPAVTQSYDCLWGDNDINNLVITIAKAEEKSATSESALTMIVCAKNIMTMRKGMTMRDTQEGRRMIQDSLDALSNNLTDLSIELVQEINLVQSIFANDLLVERMQSALTQGRVSGSIGSLDTSTIDLSALGKVLTASKSVKELRDDTRDYIKLCETTLALRCAILSDDINGVRQVLDLAVTSGVISELIVEEVALVRTEVNTRLLVSSLLMALETFDKDGFAALSRCADSFWSVLMDHRIDWKPIDRVYFDIVKIDELNEGIALAEALGLFCMLSRKLYRSVIVIRDLRTFVLDGDWERIQEYLSTIDLSPESIAESYDQRFLPEIEMFILQLNLRGAFLSIVENLKYGHAKCHTGIVDTSVMLLEPLETSINSFNNFMEQLVTPTRKQFMGPMQRVLKIFTHSVTTIKSIRKHLLRGEPEIGAYIAHDTLLSGKYHKLIEQELISYSVNIHKVLHRLSRCIKIQSSLVSSNVQELMDITTSKDVGGTADKDDTSDNVSINYLDLGFTFLVHCVHKQLTEYNLCSAALQSSTIITSSDASLIKFYLEKGSKFKIPDAVCVQSQRRLDQVIRFEAYVDSLRKSNESIFYDSACCYMILEKANAHMVVDHPHVRKAVFFQSLKPSAQLIAAVAQGLKLKSMNFVVNETLKFRRNYFKDDQHVKKYRLLNFGSLRSAHDFLSRSSMTPTDSLARSMLTYSDSGIPTSLTKLPPKLATLAVWIFNHCIKAIELQSNMHPELILLNVVRLGRACVAIRDEILLQTIKQIQDNVSPSSADKMWRLLGLCLHYFPPSQLFESYLELALIEIGSRGTEVYSSIANYCTILLHQAVFKYGYCKVLQTNLSSGALKPWLEDDVEELFERVCAMRMPVLGDRGGSNTFKGIWRGTRSDWIDRFKLCASTSVKIKHYAMVRSEFVNITSNKNLDRIDRNVLLFLIEKKVPDTIVQIKRELYGNQESFIPSSADELLSSTKRMQWLQENIRKYLDNGNLACSFEQKCSNFWDKIIERMAEECTAFPFLGRLSIVSHSVISINWEVYREIILVGMQEIVRMTTK